MDIKLLKRIASKSDHIAHKHAVFITRGGAIVAIGVNRGLRHAEVAALNNLWPDQRPGTRAISIRLRRSGTLGMAKPCLDCQEYMRKNGVKSVMYTDREGAWTTMKL